MPVMPTSPGPFNSGGSSSNPLLFILIVILGIGAVTFAILAVVAYGNASTATKTVNAQKETAAAKAKIEQKKADDFANTIANESPFRSYVAPVEYGSFEIKFPKNWSSFIDQEKSGKQIDLILNPDFVRRINATDELSAARVLLQETSAETFMAAFSSQIKRGALKQTDITVSGQHAYDLNGQFQDRRTTREVVIPVRDKVLVFINENNRYSTEFNQILAQSKIIP
ncbi:MAG: hypothetical protein JWN01_404 [Patescibacteria group bacterium]|nr:hypothetical protein [Patescibacteria group bacterium]